MRKTKAARGTTVAIGLLVMLVAHTARADVSQSVQRALRGKLIISESPLVPPEGTDKQIVAAIKKASAKQLSHTKDGEGVAGWRFSFMAFMSKKPGASQLSLDFYTNDREHRYVANKRLAGINPALALLQSDIAITEDDGVKVGGSYTVKLAATVRGKDVILASTQLVLK